MCTTCTDFSLSSYSTAVRIYITKRAWNVLITHSLSPFPKLWERSRRPSHGPSSAPRPFLNLLLWRHPPRTLAPWAWARPPTALLVLNLTFLHTWPTTTGQNAPGTRRAAPVHLWPFQTGTASEFIAVCRLITVFGDAYLQPGYEFIQAKKKPQNNLNHWMLWDSLSLCG